MEKTNIRGKTARIGMDAAIWVTDHIKEIGTGLGLLGLAAVSHRIGYRKALRDTIVMIKVDARRSTPRHPGSFDYIMQEEIK